MAKSKVVLKKKADKALKSLSDLSNNLKKSNSVRVGLPKNSNEYPDGTSLIMVGFVHEFGSPSRGIPERSYLRSTLFSNKRKYKALMKKIMKKVVSDGLEKTKAMDFLGLALQTDVREKITSLQTPRLKYRSGNPLIDTGHLRQSIVYEVGA